MTTTPRLSMTELVEAQAVPEVDVNKNFRIAEQGASRIIVADLLDTPPGSPVDGRAYLIIATAAGAWAGKEDQIAMRIGTAWHYMTPVEGTVAYDWDSNNQYIYDGADWITNHADDAAIWLGLSARRWISPLNLYTASAPQALTSGATITPDGSNGFNFTLTLAHDATLANPSNFKVGQSGLIVITQDGSGNQTLAYGSNWKFPGGAPVLSTPAGTVDLLTYYVVTSSLYVCTLTKAYSS